MGLSAGAVPTRVEPAIKAGLLELVDHAVEHGWDRRRACRLLDLDERRELRWRTRLEDSGIDGLADQPPGGAPIHGLLDYEREAIIELFEAWGEVDRSHRKLAHRGSRLSLVHVSESTVRRVLADHGLLLSGPAPREPVEKRPWPDWLEWKPLRIWAYDFTHFTRARRCAVAILDMVSRKWVATLVSAEETSTQVEVCFLAALESEGLLDLVDARDTELLREALLTGHPEQIEQAIDGGHVPLLLAVSDNGPQMRSHSTREFLAGVHIAQHFGRPHTPTDQAWIETLFGHVKGRVAPPGEDPRPGRPRGRARSRPRAVQRRTATRLDRLRHSRRRARGTRRRHQAGTPRRARPSPPRTPRPPPTESRTMRTTTTSARPSWLGIYPATSDIYSDTPQINIAAAVRHHARNPERAITCALNC